MTYTGSVEPAANPGPHGSSDLPSFAAGSSWFAPVPGPASAAGAYQVEWIFNIQQVTANYRRSEENTSELQTLMRTTYAVFCLKKKNKTLTNKPDHTIQPTNSRT